MNVTSKIQPDEYPGHLQSKLMFKYLPVVLFLFFQHAMGEGTANRDNSLKSQLIQLAYTTATLACEDPVREYYKRLLRELIDSGKQYDELTDSEISVLSKKTAKHRIDCHRDVFENRSYRNDLLVKIYCYEVYLDRFDSVETYMTRAEFFDESGGSSEYLTGIAREIELDANYVQKAAECFKGIETLHNEHVAQYDRFVGE